MTPPCFAEIWTQRGGGHIDGTTLISILATTPPVTDVRSKTSNAEKSLELVTVTVRIKSHLERERK